MFPAHVTSTELPKSHPFLITLVSGSYRDSARVAAAKGAGIFGGHAGIPTNQQIIDEMHRLARDVYQVAVEEVELPTAENWLANFGRGGRNMRHDHAFLLAAAFGLSVETFAAKTADEFNRAVEVVRGLKTRNLNITDGDFEVLNGLAGLSGEKDVGLSIVPVGTRAPGGNCQDEVLLGERSTVSANQHICAWITVPPAFEHDCEIILLEQDAEGGVYCYAPSTVIRPRDTGFTAQDVDGKSVHILPPADGTAILDTGRFSFGAPGTSTIAAILNCGSKIHFGQPAAKIKQLTAADLAPLIDSLTMRDPATWRVVIHQCIVV